MSRPLEPRPLQLRIGTAKNGGHVHAMRGAHSLGLVESFGGYGGGEVATQIIRDVCRLDRLPHEHTAVAHHLRDGIKRADVVVKLLGEKEVTYRGLGATLTLCVACDDALIVAHVGDHRAYLVRDGLVQQLTRDHVTQIYRDGVRSAVGALRDLDVHILEPVRAEDALIVCHREIGEVADWDRWLSERAEGASVDALAGSLLPLATTESLACVIGAFGSE